MARLLKQMFADRNINFEYNRQTINTRNTSNCTNKTMRTPKILTTRQMVNRITKAIPEINPIWVKEYLYNNTDGDFTEDSINDWIEFFKSQI